MVYSVVLKFPKDYILRKDGTLFSVVRLRCGHQHLTIKSAAECKDRLASRPKRIGYLIGRFGRVEEITTRRVVTEAEIGDARRTELDVAEAFRIVLALAKRNIVKDRGMLGERARQTAACAIVERFVSFMDPQIRPKQP
jgi:hypothetical protein